MIQVSSYFLRIKFKLAASWLFDHLDQIISEPCPPSNKLSRRYLQPGLHTINPLSVIRAPKDLPSQNFSCIVLSDPASLIPLVFHLPSPLVNYRSRIPNTFHSRENKSFKYTVYSPECYSACGSDL
ncbi:hypothetical protein CHARACLAT_005185 [Characodon lateralis]|uniref:Uncharacterized protein n=1 Tax=Characodon lateralis TaxID=208331 RepID=A0ABU7D4B1_9TELE|nr:hypothetical protein [Characodon lateralis]